MPVTPIRRPPESVRAAPPDAVTVELAWDASPGAEGYRIRGRAGRGDWTVDPDDITEIPYRLEERVRVRRTPAE